MSRHRKPPATADLVIHEYNQDKDMKKVNNAIGNFERRFYENLYPESAPRDTLGERFSKILGAADALKQKEKVELYLLSRDLTEN